MPIRTLAAGTAGAPAPAPTSFEIDFSGSGGALSNGTVTLDGHDFTLAGVGSSYNLYLSIACADLVSDYNGNTHAVEVVADIERNDWSQTLTLFALKRASVDGANQLGVTYTGYWNYAGWYYSSATAGYQQCQANFDGLPTSDQVQVSYATMDPTRIGLIAAGRATIGTHREVSTGSAVRVQADASGGAYMTRAVDATTATASPFGAGDYLMVQINKYSTSGGALTTTATQSASGITLAAGSSEVTIKKLYVYIGAPQIP